eukprot:Partr_v1_DN28711_c3_g1_i3_m61926 putative May negatively regulate the SNF1 kinase (By similarity)
MGNGLFTEGDESTASHMEQQRQIAGLDEGLYPPNTVVDGGYVFPAGIYDAGLDAGQSSGQRRPSGPFDHTSLHRPRVGEITRPKVEEHLKYDMKIIHSLIMSRKLAPFYRGLNDMSEVEHMITPTRSPTELKQNDVGLDPPLADSSDHTKHPTFIRSLSMSTKSLAKRISRNNSTTDISKQESATKLPVSASEDALSRLHAEIYKEPVECPICFLLYPRNINYTRCCDHAICTECFIQIKRGADFSPACCPYCVESNFGVYYSFSPLLESDVANGSSASLARSLNADAPLMMDSERISDATRMNRSQSQLEIQTPGRKAINRHVVFSDDVRPALMEYIRRQRQAAEDAARRADLETQMQLGRLLMGRPGRRARTDVPVFEYGVPFMMDGGANAIEDLMLNEAIRQSLMESERAASQETTATQADDNASRQMSELDDLISLSNVLASMSSPIQDQNPTSEHQADARDDDDHQGNSTQ